MLEKWKKNQQNLKNMGMLSQLTFREVTLLYNHAVLYSAFVTHVVNATSFMLKVFETVFRVCIPISRFFQAWRFFFSKMYSITTKQHLYSGTLPEQFVFDVMIGAVRTANLQTVLGENIPEECCLVFFCVEFLWKVLFSDILLCKNVCLFIFIFINIVYTAPIMTQTWTNNSYIFFHFRKKKRLVVDLGCSLPEFQTIYE